MHRIESRFVIGPGWNTVCRHVLALFSLEILQAFTVKGLMEKTQWDTFMANTFQRNYWFKVTEVNVPAAQLPCASSSLSTKFYEQDSVLVVPAASSHRVISSKFPNLTFSHTKFILSYTHNLNTQVSSYILIFYFFISSITWPPSCCFSIFWQSFYRLSVDHHHQVLKFYKMLIQTAVFKKMKKEKGHQKRYPVSPHFPKFLDTVQTPFTSGFSVTENSLKIIHRVHYTKWIINSGVLPDKVYDIIHTSIYQIHGRKNSWRLTPMFWRNHRDSHQCCGEIKSWSEYSYFAYFPYNSAHFTQISITFNNKKCISSLWKKTRIWQFELQKPFYKSTLICKTLQ